MELEFVAAPGAGRELLGVGETMSEIIGSPAILKNMLIDNQAAIQKIKREASST
uniref:Uncharacterized protein n=1 Tax=Peronospora matthiolae TaxID=2874970 RepID=A0AAV1V085_9STRA